MIVVTRLNRTRLSINADLIARVEMTPDTSVTMIDGSRYIVTEPMEQVLELIEDYRAKVLAKARSLTDRPPLDVVQAGEAPDEPRPRLLPTKTK